MQQLIGAAGRLAVFLQVPFGYLKQKREELNKILFARTISADEDIDQL